MGDKKDVSELSEPTRRALLGSTAVGAAGLAAGCSGGGDGGDGGGDTTTAPGDTTGTGGDTSGTPTTAGPLPQVEGQTLNWYMPMNPQDITWFGTGVFPGPQGKWALSRLSRPWNLTMQSSVWGPWVNLPIKSGPVHYETYESVDITDDEITVKIRDDANWSNGDPVTAPDGLGVLLSFRMFLNLTPFDKLEEEGGPALPTDAITGYEIVDDKTFKLLSDGGWFGQVIDKDILADYMQWQGSWGGVRANTSMEPYGRWWSAIEDLWSQVKNGEADPWTPNNDVFIFDYLKDELFSEYGWSPKASKNNYDHHWEKHFAKPENVATTGAWTPKSINGQQSITLEPNSEHYAADKVNFDEVKITVRQSSRASRSALKANSQDYYRGTIPSYIVQSFPDAIEERAVPNNGGLAYGLNHRYKLFQTPEARKAIMYAIDRERIAKAVHRTKYNPVTVPGGHGYRAEELLGSDWISNNLQSYERDLDKANQLMQEAGFSQEGGQWVDQEGNPLSVQVPTSAKTPSLGPSFANQLSQFGIDASLQTYSGSVFSEKKNAGEFNTWRTTMGIGYMLSVARFYQMSVVRETWVKNWFRIFPPEQVEQAEYAGNGIITPATEEGFAPYTLEAPPVGEPDGDLKTWHAPKISWNAYRANSQEKYVENMKKLAWIYNWHMPMVPIANGSTQNFMDTAHWIWPATDSEYWQGVGVNEFQAESLTAYGQYVSADPDNPESGASVQN